MKATVFPSKLSGAVMAPPSKSHFIRLVAAAMLADGESKIYHPSTCEDARAMLNITGEMGAKVTFHADHISISGNPDFKGKRTFHCGESGLAARLMIAIGSLFDDEVTITGEKTLLKRKLGNIAEPLQLLGVRLISEAQTLPMKISGPARGGTVVADGSESSQFVSGLLMALPLAKEDTVLIVENLKSRPYIYLTLEVMKSFGISIEHQEYKRFFIHGNQQYQPADLQTEGDWSGGAFLLVAGAINGTLHVSGLDLASKQADRAILNAMKSSGANITVDYQGIIVKSGKLKAFEFDATHCPDLFPPLAVLAAHCDGVSVIHGVDRLIHKESNRANALMEEFSKMNVNIAIQQNEMKITGGKIHGNLISSHSDHRIAMAGTIMALNAAGETTISQAECVAKSWPEFFETMSSVGANISVKI
ncbi:MAG: 3-phosphoshikimate 1-carboxyvinyltransferase [Bacteroidales bacterium]|nr:3-phosphoshikimate 1-carboxyvinyltransferase [Bacteroidales bacterium]